MEGGHDNATYSMTAASERGQCCLEQHIAAGTPVVSSARAVYVRIIRYYITPACTKWVALHGQKPRRMEKRGEA